MTKRYRCNAQLVRYADDIVILSSGCLDEPYKKLQQILSNLGLQLNSEKTCFVHAQDGFDFLGFCFKRWFSRKRDKWVTYMFPTHEGMVHARNEIRERTDKRLQALLNPQEVVESLNQFLRGWANYYSHTHARASFRRIQQYCNQKLRRFLCSRRQMQGFGYRELPDEFLYKELGLECIIGGRLHYVTS